MFMAGRCIREAKMLALMSERLVMQPWCLLVYQVWANRRFSIVLQMPGHVLHPIILQPSRPFLVCCTIEEQRYKCLTCQESLRELQAVRVLASVCYPWLAAQTLY